MGRFDNIRVVLVEPSHPGNIGGAARAQVAEISVGIAAAERVGAE